MQKKMQDH
jgi:manganese-transporting P-type ATPase